MTPKKPMTPSEDRRVPPLIKPHQYDHLIPPANRLLKGTAKLTWRMMKLLVVTAFRIPGLVKRHTPKNN
ncbi:MAG TPA: hypothetical protein VK518_09060 [Puia sp.]|nr:hypothetical protein [Puia sp.]